MKDISRAKMGLRLLAVIAVALTLLVASHSAARADNGDFSLDFIAAAPESYNHDTGGGACEIILVNRIAIL